MSAAGLGVELVRGVLRDSVVGALYVSGELPCAGMRCGCCGSSRVCFVFGVAPGGAILVPLRAAICPRGYPLCVSAVVGM